VRFIQPTVPIAKVNVSIEVYRPKVEDLITEIAYSLEDKGYPHHPAGGIAALCPGLAYKSGQELKDFLESRARTP
jgi:hypothetical protein